MTFRHALLFSAEERKQDPKYLWIDDPAPVKQSEFSVVRF
jgi:hypothetical protein